MSSRKRSRICFSLLAAAWLGTAAAQGPQYITFDGSGVIAARRGAEVEAPLRFTIRPGFHVNSSQPAEEYLIPTALSWTPGPLTAKGVTYPKARAVKYDFSEKPLLVYSGTITVSSRFAVARDAAPGAAKLTGKLRYQACNDKACFPPKTIEVSVPVTIQ